MKLSKSNIVASIFIVSTPLMLALLTWYRWRSGYCAGAVHWSVWIVMAGARLFIRSGVPWFAVAACVAYVPVGYLFATDPCRMARSHQFPIEWLSPFFLVFYLAVTGILGGASFI